MFDVKPVYGLYLQNFAAYLAKLDYIHVFVLMTFS